MLSFEWDQDLNDEAMRDEGRAEGLAEGKLSVARNMLADGAEIDFIAKYTGLPRDEIERLQQDK